MSERVIFPARPLLEGAASGPALVLDEPLSFWGGLDAATGEVIDRRHPQASCRVTGTVLVMPHGRGSSSAASVLAEAIRLGTGPAAIVLDEVDEIIFLGALAAAELYAVRCPVTVAAVSGVTTGDRVEVLGDRVVVDQG